MNILSNIGPTESVIIFIIFLLLFGTKKIPEFIQGLGEAVKEFKKALKDD